jgi:ketosteroid isomerase-like protein
MNPQQVADRLVELCRAGKFSQALDELYSRDAVSIEPPGAPSGPLGNAKGLDAIRAKGKAFDETCEKVHSITVSDPLIAGNFFSVTMGIDATYKQRGRYAMDEICVYEVRDGKIVLEQFFYSAG